MADDADNADVREEVEMQAKEANIRAEAAKFQAGAAGECYFCGEEFSRVIAVEWHGENVKSCGRCRDKRGIN